MREMADEVLNSVDLCCYLTASETGAAATRVVVVHSIGEYSAGFGALSAFQGTIMAFTGETVGDDLPVLVQAPRDMANDRNLSLAFGLREVAVPTEAELIAYFTSAGAGDLMNPIAMTAASSVRLTQLCPVPHTWAAYFLDSRTPYEF
jgi:hypothetical protein